MSSKRKARLCGAGLCVADRVEFISTQKQYRAVLPICQPSRGAGRKVPRAKIQESPLPVFCANDFFRWDRWDKRDIPSMARVSACPTGGTRVGQVGHDHPASRPRKNELLNFFSGTSGTGGTSQCLCGFQRVPLVGHEWDKWDMISAHPHALTRHGTAWTINPARAKSRARVWQPGTLEAGANHRRTSVGGFFVPAVSNAAACAWEPFGAAGVPLEPVCHPRASRLHSSVWQRTSGGGAEDAIQRKQIMQTQSDRARVPTPSGRPRLSVRKSHGQWLATLTTSTGKTVLAFDSFRALSHAVRLWWALHAPPDPSPPDTSMFPAGRARPCLL